MPLPKAELIVRGGPIWCGLALGTVEALAVWRGRVLAAGRAADVEGLAGPGTRRLHLRGRLAIPGLFDAHQHTLALGLETLQLDLRPVRVGAIDDVLRAVAARAAEAKPGDWILGVRYEDLRLAEQRHPTREELDRVAPRNPVWLTRVCNHMGVANSAALAAAGITETTPDPEGGHIEQRDGRLTGLLQERARDLVAAAIPPWTDAQLEAAIERGGRMGLAHGITSVMDAALGWKAGFREWLAWSRVRREGRLPVRATLAIAGGPEGCLRQARDAGLVTGIGDDRLRIGPVKLFTDGSASGRTAAMREPYCGGGENHGILYYSQEALNAVAAEAHAWGYQLAIHAIGDAAIEQTLNAIEHALARGPRPDARPRIEHCGYPSAEQVARARRLGVIPVPQPTFLYHFAEAYLAVLGEARPRASYPTATFVREGLFPPATSDAPVTDVNPLLGLYAMVTRRSFRGTSLGPEERVDLPTALACYTANGARACFAEGERGTLEPGRLADLAVLSTDLLAAPPEAILEARVDLTLVGGEVVHDRTGEAA